jgi:hypothetical protein
MIGGLRYTRRCRECWHADYYSLPPLNKKVIYLDQMVVSNMTKALHPTAAPGRAIDPFWRQLFEKLDVVCKMQLAICSDSETHPEESAVWTHPEALRRMYEHFSHGVSFYDTPSVREAQLTEFLENWLAGRPADPVRADRDPSSVARSTPGRNDSESQSPALSPRTGPSDSARAAGPRQKHSRSCQGSGATCRTFRSTPLISRNCRNKAAPDPIEASWVDASGFIHATRGRSISKGVLLE